MWGGGGVREEKEYPDADRSPHDLVETVPIVSIKRGTFARKGGFHVTHF